MIWEDVRKRLDAVRVERRDGRVWVRAEDFCYALRIGRSGDQIRASVPKEERTAILEKRGMYACARVMHLSPAACVSLAADFARCRNSVVREWAAALNSDEKQQRS